MAVYYTEEQCHSEVMNSRQKGTLRSVRVLLLITEVPLDLRNVSFRGKDASIEAQYITLNG